MTHRTNCSHIFATQLASLSGTQRVVQHVCPRRASSISLQRFVECAATSSTGVKLPTTHLQASQKALQAVEDSSKEGINRKSNNIYIDSL